MSNNEHFMILLQGVEAWNEWREVNSSITPSLIEADLSGAELRGANLSRANLIEADLSEADLSEADLIEANLIEANLSEAVLSGANLSEAVLSGANLNKANLSGANLSRAYLWRANLSRANLSCAKLSRANLSWANLSEADLNEADLSKADLSGADLSGSKLNEMTLHRTRKIKSGQIGINGIWAEHKDSAALMTLRPPGNSMLGNNPEAVIESLKRARRLHGLSLSLVGIFLLIILLGLTEIPFPYAKDVKISPNKFVLLAMPISIGLLSLVISFMGDALKGARYLSGRQSVMLVGNFPWTLSKYSGNEPFNKIQSLITRIVMIFHPLAYIYYLSFILSENVKWGKISITIFIISLILLSYLSLWIFIISQRFQKPILFDNRTEIEDQDDLAKLTSAVVSQTKAIIELVNLLKPKEPTNSADADKNNNGS